MPLFLSDTSFYYLKKQIHINCAIYKICIYIEQQTKNYYIQYGLGASVNLHTYMEYGWNNNEIFRNSVDIKNESRVHQGFICEQQCTFNRCHVSYLSFALHSYNSGKVPRHRIKPCSCNGKCRKFIIPYVAVAVGEASTGRDLNRRRTSRGHKMTK